MGLVYNKFGRSGLTTYNKIGTKKGSYKGLKNKILRLRLRSKMKNKKYSAARERYDKSPKKKYDYIKKRSKKKGLKIDAKELLLPLLYQCCHYCGDSQKRIGLDRIDNSKGYTLDNVLPCCPTCNVIRGVDLTVEEMVEVAKLLKKLRKKKERKATTL